MSHCVIPLSETFSLTATEHALLSHHECGIRCVFIFKLAEIGSRLLEALILKAILVTYEIVARAHGSAKTSGDIVPGE